MPPPQNPGGPGAPQPGHPGQPPRKRRTGVIIGAIVVAVLLVVGVVAAWKADRDEFGAMSDSEKSEAEKLDFSVEIQSIDNVVITGDRAEAQLTGKFSFSMPGDTGDDQMDDSSEENLVKEDGEWRVCSSSGAQGT